MRLNLLTLGLLGAFISSNAQTFNGTFIGDGGLLTVMDNTFVTNNGGLNVTTSGQGVIIGDVIVNKVNATDAIQLVGNADFRLKYVDGTTYGQLYIKDYDQASITGKVIKEYKADYNNGTQGTQQIGLPFVGDNAANLETILGTGWMNLTNNALTSAGRFSKASAFVWSDSQARFNQLVSSTIIEPFKYYVLPTFSATGTTPSWNPAETLKEFKGKPAGDKQYNTFQLSGAFAGSFGANGTGVNYFRERYNSYIDDPFADVLWEPGYGKNMYQLSNPYLTNLDLSEIGRAGTLNDGVHIENLNGIAYYGEESVNYVDGQGTEHIKANTVVVKYTGGYPQAGDVSKTIIKPLGAFMIKLNNGTPASINFDKLRSFSQNVRTSDTGVNGKTASQDIPTDKIVKQVAVVLRSANGAEVARTYYAVSPSAITGSYDGLGLQAMTKSEIIFTKEENISGGEDTSSTSKIYINEANEVAFQGKELPLFVNFEESGSYLAFETYEAGQLVDAFSNGKSFYIKKDNTLTKLDNNTTLSLDGGYYGLFYEKPEGTLGSTDLSKLNTLVAKKDANWVVRFAKDWKNANVEVYSAAGQLVHSKKGVNTSADYILPLDSRIKGIYLVKVTTEKGQEVIKKIVQ